MTDYVLVVGGSGGIGTVLCHELAVTGFLPIASYRNNREAAAAATKDNDGFALHLDLTDANSIASAAGEIAEKSSLAGVILAASTGISLQRLSQVEPNTLREHLEVQVVGQHQLLSHLIRSSFRRAKSGTVIGLLSGAMGLESGEATNSMGPYVVAKYGLLGLLRATAADYPWLNVGSIPLGFTDTPLLRETFDERFLASATHAGQINSPEDAAITVVRMFQDIHGT
jgi:NAD(P)-dependent dehydrogenase (short-subunit alcohol dehydrogenase family)